MSLKYIATETIESQSAESDDKKNSITTYLLCTVQLLCSSSSIIIDSDNEY